MRPLPRLLAFTDDRVARLDDLGVHAAAAAAAGPAVGLVARLPGGSTDALATLASRLLSLATPPMASVFVTGRADVALAVRANGVILRKDDLTVRDVRTMISSCHPEPKARDLNARDGTIEVPRSARDDTAVFRSVHSESEARQAVADGADALIVGSIWPSATHPDRPPAGLQLLERVTSLGVPTYAIGGVTGERAHIAKDAGAWGVAAIGAVWDAIDSYQAALALLAPWQEG